MGTQQSRRCWGKLATRHREARQLGALVPATGTVLPARRRSGAGRQRVGGRVQSAAALRHPDELLLLLLRQVLADPPAQLGRRAGHAAPPQHGQHVRQRGSAARAGLLPQPAAQQGLKPRHGSIHLPERLWGHAQTAGRGAEPAPRPQRPRKKGARLPRAGGALATLLSRRRRRRRRRAPLVAGEVGEQPRE